MFKKKSLLLVLLFLSFASFSQKVAEQNSSFLYSGRVEHLADDKVILIVFTVPNICFTVKIY
ncbi:hypothetical protein [Flavobacterium sp. 83]|uniref:hypothetical protein n=1 Tax=Flavobacterium sp. 83 TaxID=1131812 RepID=UPI000B158DC8|nr:hypothetical protein [Flavobacterium sp. 83]